MAAPKPTSIKRTSDNEITFTWNDGKVTTYTIKQLRDACPCAECKGESVLFQSYQPNPAPDTTPGKYDLKKIEQVGTYAIQIEWGDGHDMGIYTFERLRNMVDET